MAGITLRMCAMAACRRSARLVPPAKQKVDTPTDTSKTILLSKSVKLEPCTSPQEVCAQLGVPTSSSGSKRELAFENDRTLRNKCIRSLPRRESEKITDSFRIVKQEVCDVDKDVSILPLDLSSRRVTKRAKVEATQLKDDIKKPVVRAKWEKSKTDETASHETKTRPTVKRKIKKEKTDAPQLSNVKQESGSAEKVETSNEIALLAIGPSLDFAAQASK